MFGGIQMRVLSKRLMGVFLSFVLCALSAVTVSAEDATGCFNKLSDTVYDFSGYKISGGILDDKTDNGGYFTKHHSNTNAFNTVKSVSEDGMNVLELTHGVGGASSYIMPRTYFDQAKVFTKAHVAFSIKITGNDTDPFALTFRESGKGEAQIVTFQSGKIKFFGQDAADYELNTWYDFDARVDLTSNWGYFKMRRHGDDEWTDFERFYENINCTSSFWIGWQYFKKSSTGAKVYLTNFMQNTDEGTNRVSAPSSFDTADLNDWYRSWSANPNHKLDGINVSSAPNLDSRSYWVLQNVGLGKATIVNRDVDGDGDFESVISTSPKNATHNMMMKYPFAKGDTADRTHVMRFKMGIGDGNSERYFGFRDSTGAENRLILMYSNKVKLAASKNKFPSNPVIAKTKADYLYDCEVIYNAGAKLCVVSVTDDEGKQYTSKVDLGTYNPIVGPFFDHRGQGDAAESYDLYVDDFSWETLPDTASAESVGIAWDDDTNASLDERVIVTCSETLNQEKCIGNAGVTPSVSVTVTENGQFVQVPYALRTDGNKLFVDFDELEPNRAYTVSVSGITTLRGGTVDAEANFTTTSDRVTATKPSKSGNTVSSAVSAPYANGKKVMLIVGIYDESGKLVNVINEVGTAKRGVNTVIKADVSAYADAAEMRAFVWSDYNTLHPYSQASVFSK